MDNGVDATFHRATANRIACLSKASIIHFGLPTFKIGWRLTNVFQTRDLLPIQLLKCADDFWDPSMPQQLNVFFSPLLRAHTALAEGGFSNFPETFFGVTPINDLNGFGVVRGGNPLNPGCAIVDRSDTPTGLDVPPRSFQILMLSHFIRIP